MKHSLSVGWNARVGIWWKLTGEISVAETSGSDCWDGYHLREGEVHESSSNTGICIKNGVRWGGAFRHIEYYSTWTRLCTWRLLCLERNLVFRGRWCWFLHVSYSSLKIDAVVQYEDRSIYQLIESIDDVVSVE